MVNSRPSRSVLLGTVDRFVNQSSCALAVLVLLLVLSAIPRRHSSCKSSLYGQQSLQVLPFRVVGLPELCPLEELDLPYATIARYILRASLLYVSRLQDVDRHAAALDTILDGFACHRRG